MTRGWLPGLALLASALASGRNVELLIDGEVFQLLLPDNAALDPTARRDAVAAFVTRHNLERGMGCFSARCVADQLIAALDADDAQQQQASSSSTSAAAAAAERGGAPSAPPTHVAANIRYWDNYSRAWGGADGGVEPHVRAANEGRPDLRLLGDEWSDAASVERVFDEWIAPFALPPAGSSRGANAQTGSFGPAALVASDGRTADYDTLYEFRVNGKRRCIMYSSIATQVELRSIVVAFVRENHWHVPRGEGCDSEECMVDMLLADIPRRARPYNAEEPVHEELFESAAEEIFVYEIRINEQVRRLTFSSATNQVELRSIATAFVREYSVPLGEGCDSEECVVEMLLADIPRRARPQTDEESAAAAAASRVQVAFVHIPKTAGYAIGRCLRDAGALLEGYGFNHDPLRDTSSKPGRAERRADFISMAVVRNPYDRLHSIYEFYTTSTKNRDVIPRTLTFERFVLDFDRDWFERGGQFTTCHHFVSDERGRVIATDVLRFEHLRDEYASFCRKYGIVNNLVDMNKNQHKQPVDRAQLYTPAMRAVVERVYRADFEAFGYSYAAFVNATAAGGPA
jgi:hypothetical protein